MSDCNGIYSQILCFKKNKIPEIIVKKSFNTKKFIQMTSHWIFTCSMLVYFIYVLYHLPGGENIFKVLHQKSRYNWVISYQTKKEVCFNINQLIWTLHRLVRRTSYLFNVGLTHAHSVCIVLYSNINETEVLKFQFWLNIFGKISIQIKNKKLLKIEISIWATLNSSFLLHVG